MVWMLRSVVKVDSISLTSPSLTSGEATTYTSELLMARWTSWSLSSPRASCLLLPCSDWIAYYVHTYMKCPFCRADTSRCRMSSTNFFSWIMLFTNYSPSCLTFSSEKIDPSRFLALDQRGDTSFQ